MKHKAYGFTIVELLIVIVIIAILAAVTMVAYGGMTRRANNVAVIDAASKTLKVIQAYSAANGSYPTLANYTSSCVTSTTGCMASQTASSSVSTFDSDVATMGTLPKSIPKTSANYYGITVYRNTDFIYNGVSSPYIIRYYLAGVNQSCGITVTDGGWPSAATSTTGYTYDGVDRGNVTYCRVGVPGP